MAEGNILENITDSTGMNVENIQNIIEMENNLMDKLSEKVEEGDEKFNELKNKMSKIASGIITPTEKIEHKIGDEISEMLKETKGKLDDTVNNADCAFSGVISDLTTFSAGIQEKASEYFGDIKDGLERINDDIHEIIPEKVSKLEDLKKIEERAENENVIENLGGIVSEVSTEFEGLCKENVGDRLEDMDYQNVNEAIDKIGKLDSEIRKKNAINAEEGANKMDELIKETFGKFEKLNEEANKKIADVKGIVEEKLHNFVEGTDAKVNETNVKTKNIENDDIIDRLNENEKKLVEMNDIDVNDNGKKDELSKENSFVTAENDFLNAENIDHLQSNIFNNHAKVEGNANELMLKFENDKEMEAIKKIISPGEDIPGQVGTLSESGIYHDDYEVEKSKDIGTTTVSDIVFDKADEVHKLLDEAFNISEKLKEPEAVDDVINEKEIQEKELHNITSNPNDMATDDGKTETQFTSDKEQKLTDISSKFSSISEQTKDSNEAPPESCFPTKKSFTADKEETNKHEMIPDPSQSKEHAVSFSFTSQDVVSVNKVLYEMPDPSNNIVTSSFQSSEEFSATSNALENELRSNFPIVKGEDQNEMIMKAEINPIQEKTKPKFQSTKTEKSVNRSDSPNRTPPSSRGSAVSLQLPVRPSKNVPPPVPPKKKSIEMILAEEAKAMGQHSLRGVETLVHGEASPEIEKDELKPKHEAKQNIETSTIEEQVEMTADKNEGKIETTQKFESQTIHATAATEIKKSETQKTKPHPIPSVAEVKPEAVNEKDKTNTMKSKSGDGQQQQSRRCTIL
ncbi:hypothetical protein ACH3XW_39910 [Acanthocheilonema viteae]